MAKKKTVRRPSFFARLGNSLRDERTPKITGVFLIFLGIYLTAAFISYLFTWKVDQDKIMEQGWGLLFNSELRMENLFGRLGAMLSHQFIFAGLGLSSFVFCIYFVWIGLRMINPVKVNPPGKFVRHSLLLGVLFSIALAFTFDGWSFSFGGAVGIMIATWMSTFLGAPGMATLLISLFAGVIIWYFNPSLNFSLPMPKVKIPFLKKKQRLYEESAPEKKEESIIIPQKQYADLKEVNDEFFSATVTTPYRSEAMETIHNDILRSELNEIEGIEFTDNFFTEEKKSVPSGQEEDEIELDMANSIENPAQIMAVEEEDEEEFEAYDPTLDLSGYLPPTMNLLEDHSDEGIEIDRAELEGNKDQIIATLLNYKIEITKIRATIGPTVTLYEIVPAPGVRISKIKNLEDDIALSLAALGIRIIAPIPGKGTIGIEVPNKKKQVVGLKEVLTSDKFQHAKMDLPIALGKTISNEVFVADLAKMPHLMIAGATGQGKSVGINTILMSILYKKHPSQVKLVLIDPKKVELFPYAQLVKHFLAILPGQDEPIITETKKVINTLNSLCIEMDQRYDLLKMAHARNIKEYNKKIEDRRLNPLKGHRFLPFIVLIVDEFADLIMTAGKEVELPIARLAQLARAVGIHLIIATQRPSVNIITGVIKANFPARIGFKVTSKIDSRTILDAGGADQLIGRGDMLLSVGGDMVRLQCAFVDTPEVEAVLEHIHDQRGYPEPYMLPEYTDPDDAENDLDTIRPDELDENFDDAARLVVQSQHGSTSMIQRRLKLGYNRAGRIMDQLEAFGIVGANEGSKAREVMIQSEMELESHLEMIRKNAHS